MSKSSNTTRTSTGIVSLPNYGESGTYKLYRVGSVTDTSSGGIFLGAHLGAVNEYTTSNGHKGQTPMEYEIRLNNPLVIDKDNYAACLRQAYSQFANRNINIANIGKTSLSADKALIQGLSKSKYDAIIYKVRGRPIEVVTTKDKFQGIKGKTAKYNVYSRAGYIDKNDAIKGYEKFIMPRDPSFFKPSGKGSKEWYKDYVRQAFNRDLKKGKLTIPADTADQM